MKRRALSLTTWFYHPSLEMRGFEPLARSSAFCVAASKIEDHQPGLHFFSAAHVTHPHRFSHFYPPDNFPFLSVLEDSDIRVTVETRDENGRVLSRHPVKRRLFPHPSRDMVLLHLEDEGRFVEAAKAAGIGPCVLYADDIEGRTGLRFHGHLSTSQLLAAPTAAAVDAGASIGQHSSAQGFVDRPQMDGMEAIAARANQTDDSEDGSALGTNAAAAIEAGEVEVPMPPKTVPGFFLARNAQQSFARTDSVCETGMCGGPVEVVEQDEDDSADGGSAPRAAAAAVAAGRGIVVGMLEGIVARSALDSAAAAAGSETDPTDKRALRSKASQLLADAAVFIPAAELYAFLRHVEDTELRPLR